MEFRRAVCAGELDKRLQHIVAGSMDRRDQLESEAGNTAPEKAHTLGSRRMKWGLKKNSGGHLGDSVD